MRGISTRLKQLENNAVDILSDIAGVLFQVAADPLENGHFLILQDESRKKVETAKEREIFEAIRKREDGPININVAIVDDDGKPINTQRRGETSCRG